MWSSAKPPFYKQPPLPLHFLKKILGPFTPSMIIQKSQFQDLRAYLTNL